jgi:DNA polymerase
MAAEGDGPDVVVTTHPSALLRLRGEPGWEEALDGFVGDLEVAWRAAQAG